MQPSTAGSDGTVSVVRFGVFEFSTETGELSRNGIRVKLQEQPTRILTLLVERPGETITREALQAELWPGDTYVEFDTGLNTAVRKLRYALGDSAENPRFIETVPKVGYRFIAPIHRGIVMDLPAPGSANPHVVPIPQVEPAARRLSWWWIGAGVCLWLATGAGAWWWIRSQPAPSLMRFTLSLPRRLSIPTSWGAKVALSPTGTEIFFIAAEDGVSHVYRRLLADSEVRLISGTEGADSVVISPDGRRLAVRKKGHFWAVPVDESASWNLTGAVGGLTIHEAAAWAPDGTFYVNASPPVAQMASTGNGKVVTQVYRIGPGGGEAQPAVASLSPGRGDEFQYPQQVLPDGRLLISVVWGPRDRAIYLVDPTSGSSAKLWQPAMGGLLTPGNQLLYLWGGHLQLLPFHDGVPEVGREVRLASAVAAPGWSIMGVSTAENGLLAYVEAETLQNRELVWVDRSGRETLLPIPPGPYEPLDVSPDGQRLLVARNDGGDRYSLWEYNQKTAAWSRMHEQVPVSVTGVWAPDGASALVNSFQGNLQFPNIVQIPVTGGESGARLVPSEYGQFPVSWPKADGPLAFTRSSMAGSAVDTVLWWPGPAGRTRELQLPGVQVHPALSPDGRWLAYTDAPVTGGQVRVCGVPECHDPVLLSSQVAGAAPLWSPDGRTVYFREGKRVWAVDVRVNAAGRLTGAAPRLVFERDYVPQGFWTRQYALDRNGHRFLMSRNMNPPEPIRRIQIIANWEAALR